MYTPFPHPRYDSYEGHHSLQQSLAGGPNREFTDLSSIDLATEEDEEQPCTSKYGYLTREPQDQHWRHLLAGAAGLLAIAALCACIGALGIAKASLPPLPAPPSLSAALPSPGLPRPALLGGPRRLTARQLVEGEELTGLVASRVQAAKPQLEQLMGPDVIRERVATGFKHVATLAAPNLNSLELTLEQKDAVLHVLRDMSDNTRLHSTGLFVARALQEGHSTATDKKGVALFVLERLQPRLPELRQLRDEVIPQTFRSNTNHGVLTLDSEKLRFVETLRDRWNFELDASMPQVSREDMPALPRRLGRFGMSANTSRYVEEMRANAQDAKGAVATANGDLTTAVQGLDSAMSRTAKDTADQQQIAKSMSCDAITEAVSAFSTVNSSLTAMMARLTQARETVKGSRGKARMTVAKKVFRQLQADVTQLQQTVTTDTGKFQQTLKSCRSLVSRIDNSSLVLTRSSLVYVQGEVQSVQGQMIHAFKEFGALYRVVKGNANLLDTVKLYASSVFYQLQDQFGVPMPSVANASALLRQCLDDPNGMLSDLECRLTYAKMCLEIFLGMEVDISMQLPTSSTTPSIPALPAALTGAPSTITGAPSTTVPSIHVQAAVPPTVTVTTTTATTLIADDPVTAGVNAVSNVGNSLGNSFGHALKLAGLGGR